MKSDTMDICTLLLVLAFLAILSAFPIVGLVMQLNRDAVETDEAGDVKVVVSEETCDGTEKGR